MTASTSVRPHDCDVLIVGLGPVGAMMGALLAQAGMSAIAVEKDLDIYPLPRAAHFDHEVMRIFQAAGVVDEVLPHTRTASTYEFRSAQGELLLSFNSPLESPSGWAQGYMFHQPAVENALRARFEAAAPGAIRLGLRLESFTQDDDGVTAIVEGPNGEQSLRARYLVACDGGRSLVRDSLGVGLHDLQFDEPWLVIDVKVGADARLPTVNLQICDPARPTTCVLMGPGRHRWEFMLLPGETAEEVMADGFIEALLEPWNAGDIEIERRAVYRFHGLVTKTWRVGRVLLAGDAAHQTPPFAGQGMCAGLRDAVNLAWKLAAVLRGEADDALLDSYQLEREPHVRSFIELAIGMGRVVCTLDPEAARQRDAQLLAQRAAGAPALPSPAPPPFAQGVLVPQSPGAGVMFPQPCATQNGETRRLDDALGAGAWLIGGDMGVAFPRGRRIDLTAPAVAPFAAQVADWLRAHNAPAVLVRPDRYVFGTGDPADLVAAYESALTRS